MPAALNYTYKVAQGCQIQADVYRSSGIGPHPAILWLHGGALICGERSGLPPTQAEAYLNAGYTVVAVDYRLAPETKLEHIISDLQDAYQWLRVSGPALLDVDPERIAAVGHSAGGYLALILGCCASPPPRAIVSFYGYGDIVGSWYTQPSPFYCQIDEVSQSDAERAVGVIPLAGGPCDKRFAFYLRCRQHGTWPQAVSGHDPQQEPAWFGRYCPASNVTPEYPPTLLIHGDQDTDVPIQQSLLMAREFERCNVDYELLVLAGQGHGFDTQAQALRDTTVEGVFTRVLTFLRGHGM